MVRISRLEQQYTPVAVSHQSRGRNASGSATANNDVVELFVHFSPPLYAVVPAIRPA